MMGIADRQTAVLSRWLLARHRRPRGKPQWTLGIYKADRLGDFVLAIGVIRRLVASVGAERTVLVLTRHAEALAAREFPGVSRVIVDPTRSGVGAAAVELWRRRREPIFQAVVEKLVCLRHHRLPAESVIAGGIPAGRSWGAVNSLLAGRESRLADWPLDQRVDPLPAAPGECLELACHRAVLSAYLGVAVEPGDIDPVLEPGWSAVGSRAVATPFGSDPIRDIPRPLLAAAARHLRVVHGLGLDLLCPPGPVERFTELAAWLFLEGCPDVRIACCETTERLRTALCGSRLVLSAETGTAHMATALDAPLVAFLGGGHIGWFAPWARSRRQHWVTEPVACQGCSWYCHRPSVECLTGIPVGRVLRTIDAAIAAG